MDEMAGMKREIPRKPKTEIWECLHIFALWFTIREQFGSFKKKKIHMLTAPPWSLRSFLYFSKVLK